jgi:AAA15 family ATPase/GTPase
VTNPKGAQMIFTSHNTLPLKEILRRDQMFFVSKDNIGSSDIQSLYSKDPKIRKDASFEKDYLQGEFGSIPKIGNQLDLFNDIF